MGDDDAVTNDIGKRPEPQTDKQDRAPGGADATVLESDTGASIVTGDPDTDLLDDSIGKDDIGAPLAAEQPLSAQQEQEKVPDAIQESDQEKQDPEEAVAKNDSEPAD